MSRFRRAIHSVASGYAVLVATAIYSLASFPLAMHYLSKERFALWTLMAGISGYLSLIDLGMSSSVCRLLIDHKDERDQGIYGGLIKTGWLVLVVQASIIFAVGFGLAPVLSALLAIQQDLAGDFIQLMRWQSAALALSMVMRIFSHLLMAHQRTDITNYSQMVMLWANLTLLWLFFHSGQGVFSLVWAVLFSSFASSIVSLAACWRLKLFPPADAWGRVSWPRFQEIFAFGKDVFLVSVGTQMLNASQAMIITRQLGLAEATTWYAGTRAFTLVSWAIWRISDVSGPAFAEMIVRGEHALLRDRYKSVLILTASVSAFAAVTYALCNSLFVWAWTPRRIEWPPLNDILLGVWMIVMALLHCHNGFALLTKKVGFMRYIYFVEGLVFVCAAFLTVRWGGLQAVIICSIVCSTLFSGSYGVWRISNYFKTPIREVALRWLAPMGRVLLFFGPTAFAAWWLFKFAAQSFAPAGLADLHQRRLGETVLRLALSVLFSGTVGFYLLLRYGLPQSFQLELLQRAPKRMNPVLRRVLVGSAT